MFLERGDREGAARSACRLALGLQLRGNWDEAARDAQDACELLKSRPAAGAAFYRLGEIHRLRGEFDKAEAAYMHANERGRKPQPGVPAICVSHQGRDRRVFRGLRPRIRAACENRAESRAAVGGKRPFRSVLRRTGAVGRERGRRHWCLSLSEVPAFAAGLDPAIVQFHSSEYRNRSQLRQGSVLVVGAGNSGAEIAMELAGHHQIWLSGPDTGQEPTRAGSLPDRFVTPLIWLVATRLTVRNPLGRKRRDHFIDPPRGIPLGRVRRKDMIAAGIERVGRTTGVRDRYPLLEEGRVLNVSNVIWCAGYRPDFRWLDLPLPTTKHGFPIQDRGIVESLPGLYFVGLLFQYSLSSGLLGGVGRDAESIVDHIASRRRAKRRGRD